MTEQTTNGLRTTLEVSVQVIKPLQFDGNTPQTGGMRRLAAVSASLTGSAKLWAGVMLAEPNTSSAVHHHGSLETIVFVLAGHTRVRWGTRLEHQADAEAGDFLLIPAYLAHQEINPSPDQATQWVVVRSGPETEVVNLELDEDGGYTLEQDPQGSETSVSG